MSCSLTYHVSLLTSFFLEEYSILCVCVCAFSLWRIFGGPLFTFTVPTRFFFLFSLLVDLHLLFLHLLGPVVPVAAVQPPLPHAGGPVLPFRGSGFPPLLENFLHTIKNKVHPFSGLLKENRAFLPLISFLLRPLIYLHCNGNYFST